MRFLFASQRATLYWTQLLIKCVERAKFLVNCVGNAKLNQDKVKNILKKITFECNRKQFSVKLLQMLEFELLLSCKIKRLYFKNNLNRWSYIVTSHLALHNFLICNNLKLQVSWQASPQPDRIQINLFWIKSELRAVRQSLSFIFIFLV